MQTQFDATAALKRQLGELLFLNTVLIAERDALKVQVTDLNGQIGDLNNKLLNANSELKSALSELKELRAPPVELVPADRNKAHPHN